MRGRKRWRPCNALLQGRVASKLQALPGALFCTAASWKCWVCVRSRVVCV